jgi:hypothetical protein
MTKKSLLIALGLVIIAGFVFINHPKASSNSNKNNKNNATSLSPKKEVSPFDIQKIIFYCNGTEKEITQEQYSKVYELTTSRTANINDRFKTLISTYSLNTYKKNGVLLEITFNDIQIKKVTTPYATFNLSYKKIYMPLGDDSKNELNNKMIIFADTINSDTNDLDFPVYCSSESSSNLSTFLDTIK